MSAILVSGATGFLGSHLCKRFIQEGRTIAGLRRTHSNLDRIRPCLEHPRYIDLVSNNHSEQPTQCESLIHAATCYGRAGESVDQIEDANVRFPLRLIKKQYLLGLNRFINIDTSLPPESSAYAASKHLFKREGQALCRQLEINFINLRLEYVYGPGDDETKFPMHVIRECARNAPVIRMSPGEQLRDFIFIEDFADAVTKIELYHSRLDTEKAEYQIGSGTTISLKSFAEAAKMAAQATTHIDVGAFPYRKAEVMYSCADTEAIRALGWQAATDLETGLKRTIDAERFQ